MNHEVNLHDSLITNSSSNYSDFGKMEKGEGTSQAVNSIEFGHLLCELHEKSNAKCFGTIYDSLDVLFHERAICYTKASHFLCYPPSYTKFTFPKYRLLNVKISRAEPSFQKMIYYTICALAGICILIIYDASSVGGMLGIILLIVGLLGMLYFIAKPFVCSKFCVELFFRPRQEDRSYLQYFGLVSDGSYYAIQTSEEPNSDAIMKYCYGSLSTGTEEYHSLHHLINDDIIENVKPKRVTDGLLNSLGDFNTMERGQVSSSIGFGDILFQLRETANPSCFGTIYDELDVQFHERAICFTLSSHFLCFPPSYTKLTFPKYRLRNAIVKRAELDFGYLYLCCFAVVLGIIFLIAVKNQVGGFFGYFFLILGLLGGIYYLVKPFFSKYYVELYFKKPKKEAKNVFEWLGLVDDESYFTIQTTDEPNSNTIMKYCYGSLNTGMETYHSLNHLINDHIIERVQPKAVADGFYNSQLVKKSD